MIHRIAFVLLNFLIFSSSPLLAQGRDFGPVSDDVAIDTAEAARITATNAFHTMLKHHVLVKFHNAYYERGDKNLDVDVKLQGKLFVNKSDEALPAVQEILKCVPTAIENSFKVSLPRYWIVVVKGSKKGEPLHALVRDWFGLPTHPYGVYVNVGRTDDGHYKCL
ncbi:MAG: hypothetical protein V1798_10770 [Pseudomonadota bacterium]